MHKSLARYGHKGDDGRERFNGSVQKHSFEVFVRRQCSEQDTVKNQNRSCLRLDWDDRVSRMHPFNLAGDLHSSEKGTRLGRRLHVTSSKCTYGQRHI
ncbi:hypothetical protein EYF80_041698 [Liparis tanakae]|uniref:Uncharacterized protein n=1 Tax=Liparis tanakae TaxID=230148 RepID=A0A4Z2G3I8_9TELE|nr:hypothetical protein EYF80_041698 [Liparis tanakae]